MRIDEFKEEIKILAVTYPNVFPKESVERGAAVIIWYDHFSHIPKDIFSRAAKYCREHERFLSIASLRESIVAVADVPDSYEIRDQLANRREQDDYRFMKSTVHPIAERIYEALDLANNPLEDYPYEREYKRAREWWVEKIMQPENVALLAGPPLLEAENPEAGE